MSASPIFIGTPKVWTATIAAAQTTTDVVIATAPATGARIEHIILVGTEIKTVDIKVTSGSVTTTIWRSTLAANVPKDILAEMFSFLEKQFLILGNGDVLKYAVTVTATSTNTINIYADGGTY